MIRLIDVLAVLLVFSGNREAAAAKGTSKKIPNYPLPSYIGEGCHRNDPELDLCVVRKGGPAVKLIAGGDPKYRVPPLDPLVLESFKIQQGTKQVGLSLEIKKCEMHGLQNINFTKSKMDLKNNRGTWFFYLDELKIQGKYNVSGRVLILPITGEGLANITAKGLHFSYDFNWVLERRDNGLDYAILTNYSLPFKIDRLHIHLDNLFNGDKLLGDNMNIFLNENWEEILKELGPAISKSLGEIFRQTVTSMADLVPYQTLWPE